MNDEIVNVHDVHKSFGQGNTLLTVLRGVNLKVKKGEVVLVMGPSGSGKSTLLSFIGAIDTPGSGTVTVYGKDLNTLDTASMERMRNRDIGFVFQFHYLLPEFNVIENIMMPGAIGGIPLGKARARALELLHLIDFVDRQRELPERLSGGERQKVALARAFFNDPELIIADEPTGNMDSGNVETIIRLIKKENREKGRTFIVATHDQRLTAIADRIVTLKDGLCYE